MFKILSYTCISDPLILKYAYYMNDMGVRERDASSRSMPTPQGMMAGTPMPGMPPLESLCNGSVPQVTHGGISYKRVTSFGTDFY